MSQFTELRKIINQKGLLNKQPAYYTYKILLNLGFLATGLILLMVIDNIWLQSVNAVFMGFVFTQIGFMGHDSGHRQIFHGARKNDMIGLIVGNLLIGISYGWWYDYHNAHHGNPNQPDLDPDIKIAPLAFYEEQARGKRGLTRFIVKYQGYLYFPLILFEGLSKRNSSIRYLLMKQSRYRMVESVLLLAHYSIYLGLLFSLLGGWQALVFIAINQAIFGLYMGSVFAPNHKGMPILASDHKLDYLHMQVITARNITAHPITDFIYGGLNYQIEHHLFPSLPRNKLREAQEVIKSFCQKHSISYHETSVLQSYREILGHFHEISAFIHD
ncbi:MAG: fatty acid desaturase [bacterium]|nr:fatty acid desaturase [bacterium]